MQFWVTFIVLYGYIVANVRNFSADNLQMLAGNTLDWNVTVRFLSVPNVLLWMTAGVNVKYKQGDHIV